ncbi:hypothetical protein Lal_00023781 [Lupinus albus]|nr:hypothetical protein Lal_00023781 [Lupinus albus]
MLHWLSVQVFDPISFFDKGLDDSTLFSSPKISNEESMGEYADLKFSLLFYDATLIFFDFSCFFLSWGKCDSSRDLYLLIFSVHQFAFLIGGVQGFLYLQLLQRSGDALPASELITGNKGEALFCLFRGLKGPIASVALVVGFAVFAVVQWIFK